MNLFRSPSVPGMPWRKSSVLCGLLGLLLAGPLLAARQPPPGLDVRWLAVDTDETPLIDDAGYPALRALVTPFGPPGVPVPGLSAANFQLQAAGEPLSDFVIEPYADAAQPISVLLLLDRSVAMQPYLDQVKTAVPAFYDLLEQTDESALLAFAGPIDLGDPLPSLDPSHELGFTNDEGALINLLNSQSAAGEADWAAALQKGVRLTAEQAANERRAVILLSAAGTGAGADTAVAEALRLGVPVFTIGLGPAQAQASLAAAAQTGGVYTAADSAEALRAAFAAITGQLRQVYSLRFTAAWPADDGVHPLELTVQSPQGTAVGTADFVARYPLVPAVRAVTAYVPEPVALDRLDWVRGRVTVEPDVVARGAITAVNYYVDGAQTAVFAARAAPWTFHWNTADLAPAQAHSLLIEVVDDADPPHVGVYETAVFVQHCPFLCRIAQNGLAVGVLVVAVMAVSVAVGLVFARRPRTLKRQAAVPVQPVARAGNRRPAAEAVMVNQPRPAELAAAPTIVEGDRSRAPRHPTPDLWPMAQTQTGATLPTVDAAPDLARTEVLAASELNETDAGLAFLVDTAVGREYRLLARTTIGSASDCAVVLSDSTVAEHHARIVWEAGQFALYAATYQHVLQVNGQDVIHAALQDGDRLKIGRFHFVMKLIR